MADEPEDSVASSEEAPFKASVPFMITAAMRAQLRERDFSDEAIRNMTPQQAHEALASFEEAPEEELEEYEETEDQEEDEQTAEIRKSPGSCTLEDLGLADGDPEEHGRPRRRRRTFNQVYNLERKMIAIVESYRIMNLRQLYYRLVSFNTIKKTESEYSGLGQRLVKLRRDGKIPWEKIADNTRWVRRLSSWKNPEAFLRYASRHYHKALWEESPVRVEIWCEKDALAGVIMDVTEKYDVPLYVARGFSSETYVYNAAQEIIADGRPCYIYEFGDHDPSGVLASATTQRKLLEFVDGKAEVYFLRTAVTKQQIVDLDLPTRPTKREGNKHLKGFEGDSVELDAIPPDILQNLVEEVINEHVDQRQLENLRAAEESEREWLRAFAGEDSEDEDTDDEDTDDEETTAVEGEEGSPAGDADCQGD
jgi:hypothetical protein